MTVITKAAPAVMNYDPNFTLCGRMAKQTVRLTFGQWHYRGAFEVNVMAGISGLRVIEYAIESLLEDLPTVPFFNDDTGENDEMSVIHLGELECMDDDLRREDWLGDMLISSEIINIEPEVEQ